MSSRKIEDLHPQFQGMVRSLLDVGQKAINETGWTFFITDGYRSLEEQNKLYAQGRTEGTKILTNAKAGQSPHNYGLAVDLAFQRNGVLSYLATLYAPIYKIARDLGFELGADWQGFTDRPHFEHPNWEKLAKGVITPEKETMSKILEFLDRQNEDDAIRDLAVLIGKTNEKCDWGNDGQNKGGDLGAARREVAKLKNDLELIKQQPEKPMTSDIFSGQIGGLRIDITPISNK
jgi:peptidoglycan L-alanyl-D-glutamate endopeptidase CwlK